MKILLLTDRLDMGGAETHIAELARGLRSLGHEVAILSGGGEMADRLEKMGIRQWRVPFPTHDPFRLFAIRKQLRAIVHREGYELLHAHARIPALLLRGRWHGVGRAVTVHAKFRVRKLWARLCYWGDVTIAVSEDLREYLMQWYGVPPERIRVIPNGIDCARFSPPPVSLPHAPRILFASRLDGDCSLGAELLCDLAPSLCRRYPDTCITLVGGGSEAARIHERAKQINHDLGRQALRTVGRCDDMPSLLREHHIFVGVSRAALEAAATGLAVILCGNEGYLGILDRENTEQAMLTNFCARGCEKATVRLLERDLCTLLESPDLCRDLGEQASRSVRSLYCAEEMCRQTEQVYRRLKPTPKALTVTLGGYFGCGNTGDDAILQGVLHALADTHPEIRVTVLSGALRTDRQRYGIRCISRRNPIAICIALIRSDAFLFGGGSLLQNLTSNRSLAYYLALLRVSQLLGCPTLLFGTGIGPLLGRSACLHVKGTLASCRYIGLRDSDSLRLLRTLGTDAAILHEGADAAFLLPEVPISRGSFLLQRLAPPLGMQPLCLVLRGGDSGQSLLPILTAAARILCTRHGLYPLFLVMDRRRDLGVTRMAQRTLGGYLIVPREPLDALAVLSRCACLLTMRLHAMIFSAIAKTPAIGIPCDVRDEKLASFAKAAALETLPPDQLSTPLLVERTEALLQSRTSIAALLACSVDEMRKKATKDLANIVEMIYNRR